MSVRQGFVVISLGLLAIISAWSMYWPPAEWLFVPVIAVIMLGVYDMLQHSHTILRIYPVICHFRFFFVSVRAEIQQYFV